MSNRVLKKLQGANDLVKTDGQQSETEDEAPNVSSSSEAANKCKKLAANRFELLTGEQSLSDTAKEDDDRENEPPMATGGGVGEEDGAPVRGKLEKQDSAQSTDSLKRRKKKKKKKKQKQLSSQHSSEAVASPLEDEVAASLREVNQLLGEPGMANEGAEASSGASLTRERSLLSVDPRHLSPENEMRRIFGSRVVQSEQAQ